MCVLGRWLIPQSSGDMYMYQFGKDLSTHCLICSFSLQGNSLLHGIGSACVKKLKEIYVIMSGKQDQGEASVPVFCPIYVLMDSVS